MAEIYDIGDIVDHYGCLLRVSGVIHDQARLFVVDDSGIVHGCCEFEIPFLEVTGHWKQAKEMRDERDSVSRYPDRWKDAAVQRGDETGSP